MFRNRRFGTALGLIAVLSIVGSTLAWAAGMWSTLPVAGSASFCGSNVSGVGLPNGQGPYGVVPGSTQGTSSGICGQTIPAGTGAPGSGTPAFTGAESFPFDTHLAGGASPQTEVAATCQISGGSYTIVSQNAGTAALPNQNCYDIITDGNNATISSLTLTMPAAPLDGQQLHIATTVAITTLTINGAVGQTVVGAPTSASGAGAVAAFIYDAQNTTWYRY